MIRQLLPLLNHHKHRTKKPETYLPRQFETRLKMDPAHGGQQFEHISTCMPWSVNTAHSSRRYMRPPKNTPHAAKATQESLKYRAQPQELPAVPPQLTSELLHCLSTLPDPWPLAKITINLDTASQWVSKMGRLFLADEYVQRPGDPNTAAQIQNALKTVKGVLADLELRIIEFFSEWLVALLMPARHALETRSPHLSFMLVKDYWFKEFYLGLKVAASVDRTESFIKTIEVFFRPTPSWLPPGRSTCLRACCNWD